MSRSFVRTPLAVPVEPPDSSSSCAGGRRTPAPTGTGAQDAYRARVRSEAAALRGLSDVRDAQIEVFERLVGRNSQTSFGLEHGFPRIRTIADYRAAVPVRGYGDLLPYIRRSARGERCVLTPEPTAVFLAVPGGPGQEDRKLPVTHAFASECLIPLYLAGGLPYTDYFPELLGQDDAVLNLAHDPHLPVERTAAGIPVAGASLAGFEGALALAHRIEPGLYAPWTHEPRTGHASDFRERTYLRVRSAAAHDVRCLVTSNPAQLSALVHQIDEWWPRLAEDLGSQGLRAAGDRIERAAMLRGIVRPSDLWPNLRVVLTQATVAGEALLPRLRASLGDGVAVHHRPADGHQILMGAALERHPAAITPGAEHVFYEFAALDATLGPDTPTALLDEIEPGACYQVVVSHHGGLYRYATGEAVRVLDRVRGVARLSPLGPAAPVHPAGVALREFEVIDALTQAARATGVELRDFAVDGATDGAPRLRLALAAWHALSADDTKTLASVFDTALRATSGEYRRARRYRRLDGPEPIVVDPGAFYLEWDRQAAATTSPIHLDHRVCPRDPGAFGRIAAERMRGLPCL